MDKKKPNFLAFLGGRKFKYGGYAVVITLLGIALVVLLNIGLTTLENNFDLKIDTSQSQKYTLTDQTKKILNKLDQDIYVYTTYAAGSEDKDTQELLKKYKGVSGHVIVENKDPDLDPRFMGQFATGGESVSAGSVIVSNKDNKVFRVLDTNDLYSVSSDDSGNTYATQFKAEGAITSAINYIVTGYMPTAWLVQGHGELSLAEFNTVKTAMDGENYDMETVNLAQTPDKVKAGDLIIIANPTGDITDAERDVLKPLFEKGGRFLIMLDPVTLNGKSLPNLESLLKLYNVEVKPGLIVEGDAGRIMSSSPVYLVPNIEPHAITDPLTASGTPIIVPMAGALQLPQEPPESTMTITPLLQTSEKAYLKTGDLQSASASQEPGDESGPFVIAAALEKTNSSNDDDTARAVIIYNTAFATSTQYTNYTNNMDLVLNAANWMRNTSQDDIYIRAKALTNPVLIMQSQAQLISVLAVSVLLIPVVMLVVGIAVYLKRKHL